MKTVISIDKKLFDEADITEKPNSYYENHVSSIDDDIKEANYRLFVKEDW